MTTATYVTPINQAARAGCSQVNLTANSNDPFVTLTGQHIDSNGAALDRQSVQMDPAAFFTAMSGKTGTFQQRLMKVFMDQIGQSTATVV